MIAWLCAGCQSAYDVVANGSDGAVRLIGLPGRPAPEGPSNATVFIAGATVVDKKDDTADLVFPDGRREQLIALRGFAPFPADLHTPPTEQTVAAQALSAQLLMWRLLEPLPRFLRTAIERGDLATKAQALAVARKMLADDRIPISGRLGRWWQFAGYYRLSSAERERVAAAVGAAASGPAG